MVKRSKNNAKVAPKNTHAQERRQKGREEKKNRKEKAETGPERNYPRQSRHPRRGWEASGRRGERVPGQSSK
eukprot:7073174-Pyramimonas_sp.AAC.1